MNRLSICSIFFALFLVCTMSGCSDGSASSTSSRASPNQSIVKAIESLKQGKYDEAVLAVFSDISTDISMDNGNSDIAENNPKSIKDEINLYRYANAKRSESEMKYDMALYYLKFVAPVDGAFTIDDIQNLKSNLQTKVDEQKKEEAASNTPEEKKKRGVTIGMTKDDVLASSWGKPNKVNKTTTANGTSEQWVYAGGYLYFDNGILTAIQN